jgi:hypothetical protein
VCVIDSGDEETRSLGWIVEVAGVEEKEALLRGVRLHGVGEKGSVFEFVAIILRESAVRLVASGKGKRNLILGAGARRTERSECAPKIVERVGRGLGAVAGDEFKAGVAENDGFIASVGEHNEDGKDGVFEQPGME